MKPILLFTISLAAYAETVPMKGLQQPVEILRDKWGVPHIYAKTTDDLFFAQGYTAARDRLFQIDLWRRMNTGKMAEVAGLPALGRDRIARLVRFRGDWNKEWTMYSPDAKQIVSAFVRGINGYIDSLNGKYPLEFKLAGYAPGKWVPEDCVARVAGLLMTRNLTKEVERAMDVREYGLELVSKVRPPDPFIRMQPPAELDLSLIDSQILRDYTAAVGSARINAEQGSNNWVVDGTRTVTGKPILANDPHRPINIPSLRKTVHLVGPGWNVIGAGEPALPGIALGHNEEIAFGFTIVNIDQQDLYVERVNPAKNDEYWHKGAWRKMDVVRERIAVKGRADETVELRYTVHGPVIYQEDRLNRAYALKWVGAEPGGAGYLGALNLSRARNWQQFQAGIANYLVPSENIVYADRAGNIGWVASGLAPIRKNSSGLFPVPGDKGDYEWTGFLKPEQHPQEYNPSRHWIATANHNILPAGYKEMLSYEWSQPFRYRRLVEMLSENKKFSVADFERMQMDVTNLVAKRLQDIVRKRFLLQTSGAIKQAYERLLKWDARMTADSVDATIFAVWMARLPDFLVDSPVSARLESSTVLAMLEQAKSDLPLRSAYNRAIVELEKGLGHDRSKWQWGAIHTLQLTHPLRVSPALSARFNRPPLPRPGDGNTVNAASGPNFRQSNGASYRQIIDLADWDRSVMTNTPGESGDPDSKHYSDLLEDWAAGRYHPMPYSRKAVELATDERILLQPAR
jgi:penicillin G amidase